tara:strand:+ start:345 stop:608 length:264 start_codon:yes stop_codon:yes gene_type:complete
MMNLRLGFIMTKIFDEILQLCYRFIMKSYTDVLKELSEEYNINLKKAFVEAGIPTSTFYRAMYGQDLRFTTAKKVYDCIRKTIQSLQ